MRKWIAFLGAAILTSACSTTPTDSLGEYSPTLYLEGYLVAGRSVDSIYVGTTTPLLETFTREEIGLPDATVIVTADGQDHLLTSVGGGYYSDPSLVVQSGTNYSIRVETSLGQMTAGTTVPGAPNLSATGAAVSAEVPEIEVFWEGATEAGYITTRKALALGASIPVEFQFGGGRFGGGFGGAIDTTGFGARRDSLAQAEQWRFLRAGSSSTIDFNSFTRFGTYTFLVYTLDNSYGDFLVSSQQDPRLLDEPRTNVQGGVGLFASMAPDSVLYEVLDTTQ